MVDELLRRIVKKYTALKRRCEQKKCLLALSVAWALAGEAAGGNEAVFEHIDESIHARQSMDGQYLLPSASLMGCYPIMVQGDPFVFDCEGTTMEMIMWDFYAVLIEHVWEPGTIGQFFYDVADEHQWKAYEVESQMLREKASSSSLELVDETEAPVSEPSSVDSQSSGSFSVDSQSSGPSSVDSQSSGSSSVDSQSFGPSSVGSLSFGSSSVDFQTSGFLSDVSPFPESLASAPVFSSEPSATLESTPCSRTAASCFGSESPTFCSEPPAVPDFSEEISLESLRDTQEYLMEMRMELVNNIQNINQVIENINHLLKNNTIMTNDNAQVNNQVSSDALGGIHIHFGGAFTNYGTLTGNVENHNYPSGQQNPSQNAPQSQGFPQSQNASQSQNAPQYQDASQSQGFPQHQNAPQYQNDQQRTESVDSSVPASASVPVSFSASSSSSADYSMNSVLMSAKGKRILDALRDIHILDEHYAPVNLSWAEMGYLAYQIAFTLAIDNLWLVMGGFWGKNSNSLRSGYNRARQMPSISVFDDRIKEIFR